MESTKLLYMENMGQLECQAAVEAIEQKDGKTIVYLDQTVFYPQGGGQPYDTGIIKNDKAAFKVEEVRFDNAQVLHIGSFIDSSFARGDKVNCMVDKDRRQLHRRLHSAGHVVDMAIDALGYDWIPAKGYHFPDGPYIEYEGELDPLQTETIRSAIEAEANKIIGQDTKTEIKFVSRHDLAKMVRHVPEYLPEAKPLRVVMYGDFAVACGGTHVDNLLDIGSITIRKVKTKDGKIRAAYQIS